MAIIITLPRMSFTSNDSTLNPFTNVEREELAGKARDLLGYNRLGLVHTVPGALLYALRELDIAPFKLNSVRTYKQSKEYIGIWAYTKWSIAFIVLLTACVCSIAILNTQHTGNWQWYKYVAAIVSGILGLTSLITSIGLAINSGDEGDSRTVRKWRMVPLCSYEGVVPEYILHKAVAIKEKCPQAEFFVDQLEYNREHGKNRHPDPFLVVSNRLHKEEYYVEVWDERDYTIEHE